MAEIEISISGRKYVLSGEDSSDHLNEVAELVRDRVEALRRERPSLSLQKASILAAFDFASQAIKGKRRGSAYRNAIISKAHSLLQKVESELATELPAK